MAFRLGIRRRWLRISMRTLLLIVLVLCAWLAYVSNRARKQEELVRRLVHEGRGVVGYHHQIDANGKGIRDAPLPGPAWLRKLIGDHAFLRLWFVGLYTSNEEDLRLLSQFPSIEQLSLDQVRDEDLRFVAPLRNLKKIELSSMFVTNDGIKHFSGLRKLEELVLGHARIGDNGLKPLAGLSNLRELSLIDTQVTAEGVAWLRKRLPQLKIYPDYFPSAPDERDTVRELAKSGALFDADKEGYVTGVSFYGADVDDDDLPPLESLTRLKQLSVWYTRVTRSGIERLLRTHPNLKVSPPFPQPHTEEADAVAALNRIGLKLSFDKEGFVTAIQSADRYLSIESLAPAAELGRLKRITLSVPNLGAAECRVLGNIRSLETLWVSHGQLSDDGIKHLSRLANLKELWASGANVSDEGLAQLAKLPALQELELTGVAIDGSGLANIKSLTKLSLSLQPSAEFTDEGLAHIAEMTQLRTLSLSFAQITDEGFRRLRQLENLEKLYLEGSRVTDEGLLQLVELPYLKSISLEDTDVTSEGVAEFIWLRPDCKVDR
jgi:Leucine-rich repeat (LRR) protein